MIRLARHSAALAKRNLIGVYRNPEALLDVQAPMLCPVGADLALVRHDWIAPIGSFDEQFDGPDADLDFSLRALRIERKRMPVHRAPPFLGAAFLGAAFFAAVLPTAALPSRNAATSARSASTSATNPCICRSSRRIACNRSPRLSTSVRVGMPACFVTRSTCFCCSTFKRICAFTSAA